jgi:hypothetical protein
MNAEISDTPDTPEVAPTAGADPEPTDRPTPVHDALHVPFHGFELTVAVDRAVYSTGEAVRVTVAAVNDADRAVEHSYPGWQRVVLTVRDEQHRVVASDELVGTVPGRPMPPRGEFRDRWLPGQMMLLPTWWDQRQHVIRPGWVPNGDAGMRVEPGRYRVRASWTGREPGPGVPPPEAWSAWFELV